MLRTYKFLIILSCVTWILSLNLFYFLPSHTGQDVGNTGLARVKSQQDEARNSKLQSHGTSENGNPQLALAGLPLPPSSPLSLPSKPVLPHPAPPALPPAPNSVDASSGNAPAEASQGAQGGGTQAQVRDDRLRGGAGAGGKQQGAALPAGAEEPRLTHMNKEASGADKMEGNAGGNAAGRGVDGSMLREKVDGAEKGEAGGGIAGVTGKGVEGKRVPGAFSASTTAIVVLACRRLHYLKETIKGVLALEGIDGYRVYLSQDGADGAVMAYARGLAQDYPFVRYLNNDMRRDHSQVRDGRVSAMLSIADHYKFVLTSVFEREEGVAHAILLEEDMVVSPDILDYFQQTAPLLDSDPSLFCVSSWNDNGYRQLDLDEKRLMRTAYFPGLGWMLRKQLWTEELSAKWPHNPTTGWDHWMRVDAQARGRECIVPEVSRNRNIGEQGATVSKEDFDRKLGAIRYSTAAHTDFGDLSFLHPDAYRAHLRQLLAAAEPLSASMGLGAAGVTGKVYRVGYLREDWAALAKRVGAYVSSSPRLHSDHVTLLRRDGNTYLFYDKRLSGLAPEEERVRGASGLRGVAGGQGEDCHAVCRRHGLTCHASSFDFIQSCAELKKAFPCEPYGCSYEVGPDIPVFVSDRQHDVYGTCLVTDAMPTCEARHHSTSRLCPCA